MLFGVPDVTVGRVRALGSHFGSCGERCAPDGFIGWRAGDGVRSRLTQSRPYLRRVRAELTRLREESIAQENRFFDSLTDLLDGVAGAEPARRLLSFLGTPAARKHFLDSGVE